MADAGDKAAQGVSVAICIPTFRRPADLARLLAVLPAAIGEALRAGDVSAVTIIVIDNDDAESACSVVEHAPADVRYLVERERGVVAVRNRALDEAAGHDFAVFIDDDETPADAQWLANLLKTRATYEATVVAGPVRTVTDEPLDPWIVAGGFFARAHRSGLATGSRITRAATNNLLLDLGFVADSGIRFDARFGRTGGEDSLFTSQLHTRGARMVWCREALVLDHLPVDRRSRAHALDRTTGMANAGVRVALVLADSSARRAAVRAKALASGLIRWLGGAARGAIGAVLRSERLRAVGARERARGRGSIAGARNRTQDLYGGGEVR